MNRRQKIIVSVTGIFLVLLILVGLTYAYFLTKINGNTNDKSISVTTANLILKYDDINDILISENAVEPGKSWVKTFSATNKGNKAVTYGVALENVVNTLERTEDLVYTISCTQYLKQGYSITKDGNNYTVNGTTSGTCNGVSDEQEFPTMGKILVTNSIEDDKVQVYTLVVTYKDTGTDQSIDMNKQFSAKANLVNPSTFNSYVGSMLNSVIIGSAKNASEESDTTRTTLGSEVTEFTSISGSNEHVLNTAPDDYGTSYYFRGNVVDNYVSFADKVWRIVRINGDGSIRLILDDVAKDSDGNEIITAFNTDSYDNAYVGYMYGTSGSTTYEATHENKNDSTIKIAVDKWYEDNLKTNYVNYLSDTLFCGDKTIAESGIGSNNTAKGYGTNKTYYSATERLMYSSGTTAITTSTPTFKCAEKASDNYSRYTTTKNTLPNGKETNGNLKYPIGLLTADEVAYAGAYKPGQTNKSYYLYNSSITSIWWLSSPYNYNGSNAYEWYVSGSNGSINSSYVGNTYALRPSINLKASVLINGGDGTSSNPYTLKLS